jgi:uncharacterized protein
VAHVILLADTHIPKVKTPIPRELLQACSEADLIMHAGDLVELSVLEELRRLAPTVAVAGNMDPPEVRSVLPEKTTVRVEDKTIGLIHGWGPPPGIERRVFSRFSGVDVIAFGHTHKALLEERKGVLMVNPGSPNDRRFSDRVSYAVLDIEDGEIKPRIIWLG